MNTNNPSHVHDLQTEAYDMYTSFPYSNNVNNPNSDLQPISNNNFTHFPNNDNNNQQPNVALPSHNHQQQYDDSNNIFPNYQQYTIQQSDNSNNNVTVIPGHNLGQNYQQTMSNVVSNNYFTTPDISNNVPGHNLCHNYQQPMSNIASNNNFTTSPDISNNIPHHNNNQQPDNSNSNVAAIPDQSYQQNISNVASNNNFTTSPIVSNNNNQQPTFNNISSLQFQNQHNPSQSSNLLPLPNPFGINIYYSQAPIIIMPTTNSDIQNQLQQVLASSISTINP